MRALPTHDPFDQAPDDRLPDAATDSCDGCGDCEGMPRRRFLGTALAGAAVLLSLGMSRATAEAFPVRLVAPLLRLGERRRYPIPAADGVDVDHDTGVIVVRWQGAVYAFALSCPHQRVAVRWLEQDGRFQCPKHKSKYRPDGTFISGRATRGLDRYGVSLAGGELEVDLATLHKQDDDPAGWSAAVVHPT